MRQIPSIDQLMQRPRVQALADEYGRQSVVHALRVTADALRSRVSSGADAPQDVAAALEADVPAVLAQLFAPSLCRVINATGVILHTNLGRAPLAPSALARVVTLGGYTNLEFDLASGTRGRRDVHAEKLLCHLTGAAAAVVVNNNAAATLVSLAALAAGREVLISRGELVEIGGGFRSPEVMAQSGALLREVGTTNRSRVSDYAAAIGERTAAILRVHPSNFTVEGFTERPATESLAALARRFKLMMIEDIGSGWLGPQASLPVAGEPAPRSSIAAGVDVVLFSGDKLLGGPQAGIIAGSEPAVAAVRRHPLMRALRVDKMTYAALEATLQEHAAGRADHDVPVVAMIALTADAIGRRADRVARQLEAGYVTEILDGSSTVGGGSVPGSRLPTRLIALTHGRLGAVELEARLRASTPPVITRIEDDRVLIDLRTVDAAEEPALVAVLLDAVS